jgi:ribosomal protein L39E
MEDSVVEQTNLSIITQESSKQFVRLLKEPPKQNERFPGYLWKLKRKQHRVKVCRYWRRTIFFIIQDCDPHDHDRFEQHQLYGHVPKVKLTSELIRLLYKALIKNPKGLIKWYEDQGVSRLTRGAIEQELMAKVRRATETSAQHASA